MTFLLKYIRYIILSFNLVLGIGLYLLVTSNIPPSSLQTIRVTQTFAFTSLIYLYISVIISPLYDFLPKLPYRGLMVKARRATGVSAFFFALVHASFAFFGELGGFPGLSFLSFKYLVAISFSFTALLILTLMASTSFDFMVNKFGSKWKKIHRFVYLAVVLITIHALLLGSHFIDLNSVTAQVSFAFLAILLFLEAIRLDKFLTKKYSFNPQFGFALTIFVISFTAVTTLLLQPTGGSGVSLNIHSVHQQIAQENQKGLTNPTNLPNVPGLIGDRTLRFVSSFAASGDLVSGKEVTLKFKVYNASSGNPINLFSINYEKIAHLVIVDDSLNYFSHIHPELSGNEFSITTQFPRDGIYHLYFDFLPTGGIEQQFGYTLGIGSAPLSQATQKPDTNLTKGFGNYQVTLSTQGDLSASKLSLGTQTISFTVKNNQTNEDVTTLKPYLAAFGHMVMINTTNYDYLHVHPTTTTPPKPTDTAGPKVDFLPLGLYGPIKPGIYRVFTQLNPDGKLFTADFTVKVK